MINRRYFISAEKPHADGKNSYSFMWLTVSARSFFPDPEKVLKESADELRKQFKDDPGKEIKILAFNRI